MPLFTKEDLKGRPIKKLRQLAEYLKVGGFDSMTKEQLVEAITYYDPLAENVEDLSKHFSVRIWNMITANPENYKEELEEARKRSY